MKSRIIALVVASFLALLMMGPVVVNGANAIASQPLTLTPSVIPPPGTGILTDPSGTYVFTNLGNGVWSMNLAAYSMLLKDPHSGVSASKIEVVGSSVLLTALKPNLTNALDNPQTSQVTPAMYPYYSDYAWSGAASGFCTFTSNSSGINCVSPTYTLKSSCVSVESLTWDGHCWDKTSGCETAFWTGLSSSHSGTGVLVQNGIQLCYYLLGCGSHGSNGGLTWLMFYESYPYEAEQPLTTYPTSINGTSEEYVFAFAGSTTQPTYQWIVGSWNYAYTDTNNPYPQSDFVQSEAIFESTQNCAFGCFYPALITWAPNSPSLLGWYGGANCGSCSGYIGSSYPDALYTVLSQTYPSYIMAGGSVTGTTAFTDTWNCGPLSC